MLFDIASKTNVVWVLLVVNYLLVALLGNLQHKVASLDLSVELLFLLLFLHHAELLVVELRLVGDRVVHVQLLPTHVVVLLAWAVPTKHVLTVCAQVALRTALKDSFELICRGILCGIQTVSPFVGHRLTSYLQQLSMENRWLVGLARVRVQPIGRNAVG